MKIILTLSIIFCTTLTALSQTFSYFENNPMWRESYLCGYEDCKTEKQYLIYIKGDTIIEGKEYLTLFHTGKTVISTITGPGNFCENAKSFYSDELYGYIRQENSKVYFFGEYFQSNKPEILYDFNLSVNDTFKTNGNHIIIDSISTVEIGNQKRKAFHSKQTSSPFLIEGIGSNFGLTAPNAISCTFKSGCYFENKSAIWNLDGMCNLDVGINSPTKQSTLKAFPIPSHERIFIENIDYSYHLNKVQLTTIDGKTINSPFNIDGNRVEIDIKSLSTGIYFVELFTAHKRYYSKFIKN